ncbi:MAG TPA: NADPH:quinone oxidoreductase family protein [Polyangiaceae bacterium]|jgi:NADPH2:quinone reductase
MKALVCRAYGPLDALAVGELPDPKALAGQVVVAVKACGVNFPDLLVVQGKYQFKPPPPFAPGGEVAGVVEAVGAGVEGFRVGDRVVAMGIWGGLAQKMAADAGQVVKIPDGVDFVRASCVATAYGTTVHALRDRADLKKGETLLVLGAAGGVGLAAVQVGKRMGARVIAAASTPEKLETCRANGADLLVNYAKDDLKERVKALTDGAGADVVYDPVGGPYTEAALRATAWNGRFLVVGFTAGEIPKVPTNLVLLKGCALVGVFWGQALLRDRARLVGQIEEVLGWVQEGTITPHVHATYPLARALDALREVEGRRVQGKVVVVPGDA